MTGSKSSQITRDCGRVARGWNRNSKRLNPPSLQVIRSKMRFPAWARSIANDKTFLVENVSLVIETCNSFCTLPRTGFIEGVVACFLVNNNNGKRERERERNWTDWNLDLSIFNSILNFTWSFVLSFWGK